MFSIFKQASNEEVVLQELSEGQLTSVAGGMGSSWKNDHDADDRRRHHKHHAHHHHAHPVMPHKWMPAKKSSSHATVATTWKAHW